MSYDSLIYGKNSIEKIVSIEVDNETSTLFREDLPSIVTPNKFWILASAPLYPLQNRFVKLGGNLFYKWGVQFNTREEFTKFKFIWKEKNIFSIYDPKESHMVNYGETYFKGMKHTELSVLSFDIETTGLNHDDTAKVLLISNTFRKNGNNTRRLFCYDEYENEGELLTAWCEWVREINPSAIVGHNIYSYDLPYLDFCAKRAGIPLKLGRNQSSLTFAQRESKFRKDATQFLHYKKPKIYGREIIDTFFLSIKYDIGRKYESYALKKIIAHENLEVTNRQFYEADQIRFKYKDPEEWIKIKLYAEHDADDSLALFDLMIPAIFYFNQSVPKSFQSMIESASGSQLNSILVRSYLQDKHSIPRADEKLSFQGAISWGNPGVFKNCKKWDISSLYPSIILEYQVFSKSKDPNRNFLKMVNYFTEQRLTNKKLSKETGDRYYDDLQGSQKIGINSSYGLCGAPGLNFNYSEGSAFITRKGREILEKAIIWATSKEYRDWNPAKEETHENE